MADNNVHRGNRAFSQCTDVAWLVGGMKIEKRSLVGYPYNREIFVYTVTATWSELFRLGITHGVSLPEGRKRLNSGNFVGCRWWKIRAVKGGRWALTLDVYDRISSIEALIAGRPCDPNHEPWRNFSATQQQSRLASKAKKDQAFQAFKNRLLGVAE